MRSNVKKTIKITIDSFWPALSSSYPIYENYLIRIVMNINKTSKIAYWLSSKWEGGGSIFTLRAMLCPWARHIYSETSSQKGNDAHLRTSIFK